jgi:hypothetical protein
VLGLLFVFREPLRLLLRGRETPAPGQAPVASSDSEVNYIERILDTLVLDLKKTPGSLSKETLLEAYSDVVIEAVETNADVRLPTLSIPSVEKIVNERYHAEICKILDNM